MKRSLFAVILVTGVIGSGAAFAKDICDVPKDKWQPMENLRAKLEADGWKIKKLKVDDGCYEAYAKNEEGERVEAYFNPETLEVVKIKNED